MIKVKQRVSKISGAINTRMFAVVFISVICASVLVAAATSQYDVTVVADGNKTAVTTSEYDAKTIVAQAGVTLGDNDVVNTDKFVSGNSSDDNIIKVYRAENVKIIDDGEEKADIVCAGTVKDALTKAGITVRDVDEINYDLDTEITKDMTIEIKRAYVVEVTADGKTQSVDFVEGTVADVLTTLGIELGENDETEPSINTELKLGDSVTVNRVTYKEEKATETINYTTSTEYSSSVYIGETQVKQYGSNGSKNVTYKVKYVNGVRDSKTAVNTVITKYAVNKVIIKGTKVRVYMNGQYSPLSLPTKYSLSDGIPTSSVATITGGSTWYYPSHSGCGTAGGYTAGRGYVAVNPNQIPYGSELYIVSKDGKYVYGYCIAADTGSFWKGTNTVVDVAFNSYADGHNANGGSLWPNPNVVIYVLSWGK